MRSFEAVLEAELAELVALGRRRACPEVAGLSRTSVAVSGEPRLSFCSNDYLGLAEHPALATAAAAAAARDGFGASASRLVSGDLPAHRQLEEALARFFGRQAALVFPSGYQTNIGVLTALAGPDDVIVSDALNHASIIDGCRLSRARIAVYPHGDADGAARLLDEARTARRRLLVTESLFSMNGDAAPLAAAGRGRRRATTRSSSSTKPTPSASSAREGVGSAPPPASSPTSSSERWERPSATAGGFVAGSRVLRELLVNRARSFIFTTALPPPVAAAALAALEIVDSPEGDRRRACSAPTRTVSRRSWPRSDRAASGPRPTPSPAAPSSRSSWEPTRAALALSAALAHRQIFVPAIRPPTVPVGSARLRITLSASHDPADLDRLVLALRPLA